MTTQKRKSKLRAVGYARTSSKNQKDNTSIPRQQEEIKKFIANNDWKFIRHYVDESLTGTTIEGRDDFKLMMKDAANSQFDIIVIFNINRFARDGSDIITQSKMLKTLFGVYVIDTKGYDTRKRQNVGYNFYKAGSAEEDRLILLENTRYGCVDKAEDGLQWAGKTPFGRAFKKTGKNSGEWSISKDGEKMKAVLEAYVDGDKSLHELAQEYGFTSAQTISRRVRQCQLAAKPYRVVFNTPEVDIVNRIVEVPAVPPVITKELEQRVLAKMQRNKRRKRKANRDYLLSGIVKCAHCGKRLTGQSQRGRSYYTHNNYLAHKTPCPYNGIRLELLESHVMNYLANFFFDKPAFEQAVKNALPTNDDREAIVKDIEDNKKAQKKTNTEIANLVKAVAGGADVSLMLDTQNQFKAEKQALERRGIELEQTLATMPDPEVIKAQAEFIRAKMLVECLTKNWQDTPYKDLRKFLHFLFSDDPEKNNLGILLSKKNDKWFLDFEGRFDFNHVVDAGNVELKANLSDSDKAKITEQLNVKNDLIKTYNECDELNSKTHRLETLVNEAERLETVIDAQKTQRGRKGKKLFNGKANIFKGV